MPGRRDSRRNEPARRLWLGYLRRHLVEGGELGRLIEEHGVAGVVIDSESLAGLIRHGNEYRSAVDERVRQGASPEAIEEGVRLADERAAADALTRRYYESEGDEGIVALDVAAGPPDTDGEAQRAIEHRAATLRRPNIVYRIPACPGTLALLESLASAGYGVQATCIHSLEQLTAVARAWLTGLWRRKQLGQGLADARLFLDCPVAALDMAVDVQLARLTRAGRVDPDVADALRGKASVAVGTLMIDSRRELLAERAWKELSAAGARPPTICWSGLDRATTAVGDCRLAASLIGGECVGIVSLPILYALRRKTGPVVPADRVEAAREIAADLDVAGVDLGGIGDRLRDHAMEEQSEARARVAAAIRGRGSRSGAAATESVRPGALEESIDAATQELLRRRGVRRLWARDPTLWTDAHGEESIAVAHRLGWLGLGHTLAGAAERLSRTFDEEQPEAVLLVGMGGSSLGSEACALALGAEPLHVLDTTVPDHVLEVLGGRDLEQTHVVVSSKSGTTVETLALEALLRGRAASSSEHPASRFAAITDPGTPLHELAVRESYGQIWLNPTDIGGRFSVLSYFGLAPLSAAGVDVEELLRQARVMELRCAPEVPCGEHPGAQLAALLAAAHAAGRDKLTIWTSPGLEGLADWIEQLVAESTGKNGLGMVPVTHEPCRAVGDYLDDRVFAVLELRDRPIDRKVHQATAALADRGHPVARWTLDDPHQVAAEFVRWQVGIALCGALMGINPFDQPDVENAKRRTSEILAAFLRDGSLWEAEPVAIDGPLALHADLEHDPALARRAPDAASVEAVPGVARWLVSHLGRARSPDYFCVQAFLAPGEIVTERLERLRMILAESTGLATTMGWGPRFLHSTGQLHKGGPDAGVFLQLTADTDESIAIPGAAYGLETLCRAQALGDLRALQERGRRVVRVHMTGDVGDALTILCDRVAEGLP